VALSSQFTDLVILADVVDNFGDIGVSWRLCRHLLMQNNELCNKDGATTWDPPEINIRLVTNNLKAFHNINDQINTELPYQKCKCGEGFIEVYDWTNYDFCYKTFTENPPEIILEMFQCGQPDWLEKILFEDRVDYKVHIIMIDYLTAETWADDFHCLKSLTRTAWVPKVNFMPGFTKKTGGLLINKQRAIDNEQYRKTQDNQFSKVLYFAYPSDWTPVIRAMNKVFDKNTVIKIAGGAGQKSILEACSKENIGFQTEALSYMNQTDWDQMMQSMDFMLIRGEDSMSQACCSGIPFIWQAYPQNENYQMVKVQALLERMKPHFGEEFLLVEEAWNCVNSQCLIEMETAKVCRDKAESTSCDSFRLEKSILAFLNNLELLKPGFRAFAKSLQDNGDLAVNLMTFIKKNIKIEK